MSENRWRERLERLRDDILVIPYEWITRTLETGGARVTYCLDDPYRSWCEENLSDIPSLMVLPDQDTGVTPVIKFASVNDMIQFKLVWLTQ